MVPLRSCAALVASWLFGMAITPSRGRYSDPAITWVILGLIVVGFLFWSIRRDDERMVSLRYVGPVLWVGLCVLSGYAAWRPNVLSYAAESWEPGQVTLWGVCFLIVTYGYAFVHWEARWVRHARFVAIAVLVAVTGVLVIKISPSPKIDVWTVQQEGAAVFLSGRNPFQDVHLTDTGPRVATDVPYVYPPLHLYVSSVAFALTGDVRYGAVLALILLGFAARALSSRMSLGQNLPAILEDAPALLIWCSPMLAFIIEQGWIDPLQLCWCSAVLLAWDRPWALAVLAGFLLGAKQTMVLMVLPVGLALRLNFRQWMTIGIIAALPLVPWLIWDFRAYKHANFDFLNELPARPDALTVVVWAQRRLGLFIPWALAFPSAALVIALSAARGRQSMDRAAITVLTAMTLFFSFNKWAFANYYFTLLSLAALAAAASLNNSLPLPRGDR